MVTNAICAIIRTNDDGTYRQVGSHECMWQGYDGYKTESYGENDTSKATVYIPDVNADVRKGDYIAKNMVIKGDIAEDVVSKMLTIVEMARHDYGSPHMQHVRVIAQ